ncbi:MAG TPA: hypothetical protein VMI34_11755 [Candidatus Bathyarchaeia archaeon]|nr:hypothetical protein [Candidatus Bathyarchaeia archaeon]
MRPSLPERQRRAARALRDRCSRSWGGSNVPDAAVLQRAGIPLEAMAQGAPAAASVRG